MKFFMSSNPLSLRVFLGRFHYTATVEAEYGDELVTGTIITMAHHGSRAGQPAPCSYSNRCMKPGSSVEVVGLSHIDLDALGGCMAIVGNKPEVPGFWELAEFVDLNGAHKLAQSGASEQNLRRLHAFWAWSEKSRVYAPRDGSVIDVTVNVKTAMEVLDYICQDDEGYLKDGDKFKAAGEKLNADTFLQMEDGVILRVGPSFVNHLYRAPDGVIAEAVVAFNTTTGGITVSFAEANPLYDAKGIMQLLLGNLAGGHAGIAGSPRDTRCTIDQLREVYAVTQGVVRKAQQLQPV